MKINRRKSKIHKRSNKINVAYLIFKIFLEVEKLKLVYYPLHLHRQFRFESSNKILRKLTFIIAF
jgi:hypothetical protein